MKNEIIVGLIIILMFVSMFAYYEYSTNKKNTNDLLFCVNSFDNLTSQLDDYVKSCNEMADLYTLCVKTCYK